MSKAKYRLVNHGEEVQASDEILLDDCENWAAVDGWAVGMVYSPALVPMRRPIATQAAGK